MPLLVLSMSLVPVGAVVPAEALVSVKALVTAKALVPAKALVMESIAAKAIEEEPTESVVARVAECVVARVIGVGSIGEGRRAAPGGRVVVAIGTCVLRGYRPGCEQAQADPTGQQEYSQARWGFHYRLQNSKPLRCSCWKQPRRAQRCLCVTTR